MADMRYGLLCELGERWFVTPKGRARGFPPGNVPKSEHATVFAARPKVPSGRRDTAPSAGFRAREKLRDARNSLTDLDRPLRSRVAVFRNPNIHSGCENWGGEPREAIFALDTSFHRMDNAHVQRELVILECAQCEHRWLRKEKVDPKRCANPKCRSMLWRGPKRNQSVRPTRRAVRVVA